jgi:hypothetical protein
MMMIMMAKMTKMTKRRGRGSTKTYEERESPRKRRGVKEQEEVEKERGTSALAGSTTEHKYPVHVPVQGRVQAQVRSYHYDIHRLSAQNGMTEGCPSRWAVADEESGRRHELRQMIPMLLRDSRTN